MNETKETLPEGTAENLPQVSALAERLRKMQAAFTVERKLHALGLSLYGQTNAGLWAAFGGVKVGQFYTLTRPTLELFYIHRIDDEGKVFFINCGQESLTEQGGFAASGFTTEGFGTNRVYVPETVFTLPHSLTKEPAPEAQFSDSPFKFDNVPEKQDGIRCPRRDEGPGYAEKRNVDEWQTRGNGKACSYCGSMNPDEVLRLIEAGECKITPTDKNYKIYVSHAGNSNAKFYFQHFSQEQKERFVQLYNEKKISLDSPGHFYVLPFFMARVDVTATGTTENSAEPPEDES